MSEVKSVEAKRLELAEWIMEWAQGPTAEAFRTDLRERKEWKHRLTGYINSEGGFCSDMWSGCRYFYLDANKPGIGLSHRMHSTAGFVGMVTKAEDLAGRQPLDVLLILRAALVKRRAPARPVVDTAPVVRAPRVLSKEERQTGEWCFDWNFCDLADVLRRQGSLTGKKTEKLASVGVDEKDCPGRPEDVGGWGFRLDTKKSGWWVEHTCVARKPELVLVESREDFLELVPPAVFKDLMVELNGEGFWFRVKSLPVFDAALHVEKLPGRRGYVSIEEQRLKRRLRRSRLRPLYTLIRLFHGRTFGDLVDEEVMKVDSPGDDDAECYDLCLSPRGNRKCRARYRGFYTSNMHGTFADVGLFCDRCGLDASDEPCGGAGYRVSGIAETEQRLDGLMNEIRGIATPEIFRSIGYVVDRWRSDVVERSPTEALLWGARILGATRGELEAVATLFSIPDIGLRYSSYEVSPDYPWFELCAHWRCENGPFGAKARRLLQESGPGLVVVNKWKR